MSIKIYLYPLIRKRDLSPMILTSVPRSRGRGNVKIVFVLLKDHHFPKREKTPITLAENNDCSDLFRGSLAKISDYFRRRFRFLVHWFAHFKHFRLLLKLFSFTSTFLSLLHEETAFFQRFQLQVSFQIFAIATKHDLFNNKIMSTRFLFRVHH